MMLNILKKNLQEKRKILTSFDPNVNRDGIKEVAKIAICVEEGAAPPHFVGQKSATLAK